MSSSWEDSYNWSRSWSGSRSRSTSRGTNKSYVPPSPEKKPSKDMVMGGESKDIRVIEESEEQNTKKVPVRCGGWSGHGSGGRSPWVHPRGSE